MPTLSEVRDAVLNALNLNMPVQGLRKEDFYKKEDHGIKSVYDCLTFYARSKSSDGFKVMELKLWPLDANNECFEVAITITHGMDVDDAEYGYEGPAKGNRWFLGAVLESVIPKLRDANVRYLVAVPWAKAPDRRAGLTKLWRGCGFVEEGPPAILAPEVAKDYPKDRTLTMNLGDREEIRAGTIFWKKLLAYDYPWPDHP